MLRPCQGPGLQCPSIGQNLDAFVSKWAASGAAERANKDLFLADLCAVLGVAPPDPSTGDPERDLYVFEREAKLAHEGGEATIGRIDLYKQDCFILLTWGRLLSASSLRKVAKMASRSS